MYSKYIPEYTLKQYNIIQRKKKHKVSKNIDNFNLSNKLSKILHEKLFAEIIRE